MSYISDGGSAFPIETAEEPMDYGMSLRDYFAAKVLMGISANPEFIAYQPSSVAELAYEAADAMLKAREERK